MQPRVFTIIASCAVLVAACGSEANVVDRTAPTMKPFGWGDQGVGAVRWGDSLDAVVAKNPPGDDAPGRSSDVLCQPDTIKLTWTDHVVLIDKVRGMYQYEITGRVPSDFGLVLGSTLRELRRVAAVDVETSTFGEGADVDWVFEHGVVIYQGTAAGGDDDAVSTGRIIVQRDVPSPSCK